MRQYNVPALEKAIAILDLLARSDRGLTATEIHLTVGIPKATAFMVLNVLERYRMVKRDEQSRFTIGVKLFELGNTYVSKLDIVKIARPHLEWLRGQTNLTVQLGIIHDRRMMFIDKVEPNAFIRFSSFPGMRSDIHISSLGKALAAYLPAAELDAIVAEHGLGAYTPHTITDLVSFQAELARVRDQGYAFEDEEGELGVRCVGAPIFGSAGIAVAAVSVTGLVAQIPEDALPHLGALVRQTAAAISSELGYAGGEASPALEPVAACAG